MDGDAGRKALIFVCWARVRHVVIWCTGVRERAGRACAAEEEVVLEGVWWAGDRRGAVPIVVGGDDMPRVVKMALVTVMAGGPHDILIILWAKSNQCNTQEYGIINLIDS